MRNGCLKAWCSFRSRANLFGRDLVVSQPPHTDTTDHDQPTQLNRRNLVFDGRETHPGVAPPSIAPIDSQTKLVIFQDR